MAGRAKDKPPKLPIEPCRLTISRKAMGNPPPAGVKPQLASAPDAEHTRIADLQSTIDNGNS
jgi:hypothetical protein